MSQSPCESTYRRQGVVEYFLATGAILRCLSMCDVALSLALAAFIRNVLPPCPACTFRRPQSDGLVAGLVAVLLYRYSRTICDLDSNRAFMLLEQEQSLYARAVLGDSKLHYGGLHPKGGVETEQLLSVSRGRTMYLCTRSSPGLERNKMVCGSFYRVYFTCMLCCRCQGETPN